jgi:hypothetical protein
MVSEIGFFNTCRNGGIGRRVRFRSVWEQSRGGSSPLFGTDGDFPPRIQCMIWTHNLAYAVGLITTDGNLSKDGRHILFVSKDLEQVQNLVNILQLNAKISLKKGGYTGLISYYFLQFSHVELYRFLISIGLHPNKSKTLNTLDIPERYFADFLRGVFDGDGSTYSYWDKRWKSSFMFYLAFTSACLEFLNWLKNYIHNMYDILGVIKTSGKTAYQLVYAKKNSFILIDHMYAEPAAVYLTRKKSKIERAVAEMPQYGL